MNHHHARKQKFLLHKKAPKKRDSIVNNGTPNSSERTPLPGTSKHASFHRIESTAEEAEELEGVINEYDMSQVMKTICDDVEKFGEDLIHDHIYHYNLSDRRIDLNTEDEDGHTLLMLLADKGYHRLFHQITENVDGKVTGSNKASINYTNSKGYTVLMAACEGGSDLNVVKRILSHIVTESYVNAKDSDGYTAMMLAAFSEGDKSEEMVEYLLNFSQVELHHQDKDGLNCLLLAALKNKLGTVRLLFDAIENIDTAMCHRSEEKMVVEFKRHFSRSLGVIKDFCELNPNFAEAYLLCEDMELQRVEDLDVDYNHKFPIKKGAMVLAGSDAPYSAESQFWPRYFGDNTKGVSGRRFLGMAWAPLWARIVSADILSSYSTSDAGAFSTPIPDLASIEAICVYAELAETLESSKFFASPAIQAAVDYAWVEYGFQYHFVVTSIYVAFLIVTSIANYRFYQNPGFDLTDPDQAVNLFLVILVLALNSFFISYEGLQLSTSASEYFSEVSNYVDIFAHGLVYAGYGMRVYYAVDTSESAQIIAAATILLWMNLLYYLRPFKATSAVVRMLYVDINNELKAFIFILTFLLFGFSQSLFMLSENDATQPFGSPDTAFLSAFISMMGQTNWNAFTNTRYEGLGQLIGVLLVTACAVIMLNILIAILSISYENIYRNVESGIRLEMCRVMEDQYRFSNPKVGKYVFVLKRLDDIGAEEDSQREASRFDSLKKIDKLEESIEHVRKLLTYEVPKEDDDEEGGDTLKEKELPKVDLLRADVDRVESMVKALQVTQNEILELLRAQYKQSV